MNPVAICRIAMKSYPAVVFLLTIVVVSEARIDDYSIVDEFNKCTSELRVKIQGSGKANLLSAARINCKDTCIAGVVEFKNMRCPEQCGITLIHPQPRKGPICHLCYNAKKCYILLCKRLIDFGVNSCAEDCEISTPETVGTLQIVNGTSGDIRQKFPSALIEIKA